MSGYVGANSVAEKIGKLYWGDGSSLAQVVQKAYVGDPRGVAELWYQLGTPLGDRAVGGKVYFNVNNIRTEWIIVHQGLPGAMYDASCSGAWLLCNSSRFTGSYKSSGTGYKNSASQTYLENTFFRMIQADIKPLVKQVRIPYMGTNSFPAEEYRKEGADGLAAKVFLPSITELKGTLNNTFKEGAALSYFLVTSDVSGRRKWSRPYWTRTPSAGGWTPSKAVYVTANGGLTADSTKSSYSYRPILVLPQEVLVDGEGNVLGG